MPTYEYRCDSCKRRYERREGFSAPSTHPCDRCKKGTATRILHAPTVVFKGSGFYVTDSKKSQESKSSDSSDSSTKKTGESSKSDGSKSTSSKGDSAKGKSAKSSERSSKS